MSNAYAQYSSDVYSLAVHMRNTAWVQQIYMHMYYSYLYIHVHTTNIYVHLFFVQRSPSFNRSSGYRDTYTWVIKFSFAKEPDKRNDILPKRPVASLLYCAWISWYIHMSNKGLFCKRALQKRRYSAKETYCITAVLRVDTVIHTHE